MSDYYAHNLGTSFGFIRQDPGAIVGTAAVDTATLSEVPSEDTIFLGVISKYHSFRTFGLHPRTKPEISAPEAQTASIVVPGRDGEIDMTEALDGNVHFSNRRGEFNFTQLGGRRSWDGTYAKLKNLLHGRVYEIVMDEEHDGYYRGRLNVETPVYDDKRGVAYFSITANLEPFKYGFSTTVEPWLWDPFSFVTGVIRDYANIEINDGGTITIIGSALAVVPDIQLIRLDSEQMTVTYPGRAEPLVLRMGSNEDYMTDLVMRDEEVPLTFTGSGKIRIAYKTGVL